MPPGDQLRCNSLFAVNDEAGVYYALDPEAGDEVRQIAAPL